MKVRGIWAGSLLGALLASICCLGPLVVGVLGVGSLGAAAALAPLRPWFLLATGALLGFGFFLAYRPIKAAACGPDGDCPAPPSRSRQRAMLWVVSALTIVLATYPSWSTRLGRPVAKASTFPASSSAIILDVSGMTCVDCEIEIERELERQPGVRKARVSYEQHRAWVALSGPVDNTQLAAAVARAGYRARIASRSR